MEQGYQALEEFWGVELSSKNKRVTWGDDNVEDDVEMTLELRQACLGAKAKPGERNVVQVTAENEEGDEVTHAILSMKVGGIEQSQLYLTLHPPVTFELAAGCGPLHIVGSVHEVLMPFPSSDEEMESEEEETEQNEMVEPTVAKEISKKRPAPSSSQRPSKVPKLVEEEEESDQDEDEDEDEDEEEFSDEDESEEEDSEEESEEEEEESEEEQKPVKPMMNGKPKGKPTALGKLEKFKQQAKTPQPTRPSRAVTKGTQSAPTTPKGTAGDKKAPKSPMGIDEVKQKLLKSKVSLPKKQDKFGNFLSNSFKITDEKVKKQLWEFVQKNRLQK